MKNKKGAKIIGKNHKGLAYIESHPKRLDSILCIGTGKRGYRTGKLHTKEMDSEPILDLIIKGRSDYTTHDIGLTINGWKQLRVICRQAIRIIKDDNIKYKNYVMDSKKRINTLKLKKHK